MRTLFINNLLFEYIGDRDSVFCVRVSPNISKEKQIELMSLLKAFYDYTNLMGAQTSGIANSFLLGWSHTEDPKIYSLWLAYPVEEQNNLLERWKELDI